MHEPAPVSEPASPDDGLERLPRGELLGRARELDIDGRTKMSKAQLISAIRRAA